MILLDKRRCRVECSYQARLAVFLVVRGVSVLVRFFGFVGALLGAVFSVSAAVAGIPDKVISHRALYEVTLKSARVGSGISDVKGRIVVEWSDACEGFTMNQRFYTELNDSQGNLTASDRWISSWEAHDGSLFRFDLTDYLNGKLTDRATGRATGSGKADNGKEVRYGLPSERKVALPGKTIFPTQHTFEMLEAAQNGQRIHSSTVFDGSVDGEFYDVVAFIAGPTKANRAPDLSDVPGSDGFSDMKSWQVVIAYYLHGAPQEMPEYEFGFVLYENGVAADLVMDYSDFSLQGRLSRIDTLPDAGC